MRDNNAHIIDVMMSLDKMPDSPRKQRVMKSLAQSLSHTPKIPWYKRMFTRRTR